MYLLTSWQCKRCFAINKKKYQEKKTNRSSRFGGNRNKHRDTSILCTPQPVSARVTDGKHTCTVKNIVHPFGFAVVG